MGRLFGTDGIRGLANQSPITPEIGFRLGRAMVRYCRRAGIGPALVIGRDTRSSGDILAQGIASGVVSDHGQVYLAGVLPTPGVAHLIRELEAGAGIVVSASHNPHHYNGFKVFTHEGYKISQEDESFLEDLILSAEDSDTSAPAEVPAAGESVSDAVERYVSFLTRTYPTGTGLQGMRLVLDCANGATYRVAPAVFGALGADIEALSTRPDGRNINHDCGSEHPESLMKRVRESHALAGLAFDGDGDRVRAVDETGRVLTGDQVLAICAQMLKAQGALTSHRVVSTVMSNMGLRFALNRMGLELVLTQVGDRQVMKAMQAQQAVLGGEESGHFIFANHHTTGDGILSGLQLLAAIQLLGKPLSELSGLMTVFPQTLINVPVGLKPDISEVPELTRVIEEVSQQLGDRGRVLVRYSGTEPLCRIMVEGQEPADIEQYAGRIADVVSRGLGPKKAP